MLADAVFDVVSERIAASRHRRHEQPEAAVHRQQSGQTAPHGFGQPGLEREHAEREAAAVEQHDAPVDLRRPPAR